jgi:hypothetical protein
MRLSLEETLGGPGASKGGEAGGGSARLRGVSTAKVSCGHDNRASLAG